MGQGTWRGSQSGGGQRDGGRAPDGGGNRWNDHGSGGGGGDDRGANGGPKKVARGYRDLIAWQKAMELAVYVYRLVQRLPADERPLLGQQLFLASVAVATNIAEGQGWGYSPEFARALATARGKLAELDSLLLVALDLGFLKSSDIGGAEDLMGSIRAITHKLTQRLRDGPKNNDQRRGQNDDRG